MNPRFSVHSFHCQPILDALQGGDDLEPMAFLAARMSSWSLSLSESSGLDESVNHESPAYGLRQSAVGLRPASSPTFTANLAVGRRDLESELLHISQDSEQENLFSSALASRRGRRQC